MCSYQWKNRVLCFVSWKGKWSGHSEVLLGPVVCCRFSLFGGNGAKFALWCCLGSPSWGRGAAAVHQPPPCCSPPACHPQHHLLGQGQPLYSLFTQFLALEEGGQTGPGGAEPVIGAGSSSLSSLGNGFYGLLLFPA